MRDLRSDQILFGRYTLLRPLRSSAGHPAWLARDDQSGAQVGLWLFPASDLTRAAISEFEPESGVATTVVDEDTAAIVLAYDDPAHFSRNAALLERLLEKPVDEDDLIEAEEFESIEPVEFKKIDAPAATVTRPQRNVPGPLFLVLLAVSIAIAVGVFFFLPDLVAPPAPVNEASEPTVAAAPAGQSPPAQTVEGPKELAPWERAQILKQKEAAEAVLEEFIRKQFDLEESNVAAWGEAEFNEAKEHARTGDGHFSLREYEAAQQSYQTGLEKLIALEQRAPVLLAESLSRGQAALEGFDSGTAREAFEAARALDPDNQTATAGLKRAETLDAVDALLAEGLRAESRDEFIAARDAYREALALDPATTDAEEGLQRVSARIASDQFSVLMSQGYAALSAGQLQQADAAFKRARELKPGSPEVAEALAQTDMQRRLTRIAKLRAEAEQLESQEDWAEALDRYQKALELDANLAFARRGSSRTQERAELDKRLAEYLAQPERLSADAVYEAAQQLLAVAQSVQPRGPELSAQIQQLQQALSVARLPVTVRLESDNKTDVTLFRVGQLGSFATREIELRPGTYTVVGTRSGYRDVRHQFTIVAGRPADPVVVRCEEKI